MSKTLSVCHLHIESHLTTKEKVLVIGLAMKHSYQLYRKQTADAMPEADHQHLNPASLVAKGSVMLFWCYC